MGAVVNEWARETVGRCELSPCTVFPCFKNSDLLFSFCFFVPRPDISSTQCEPQVPKDQAHTQA